MPARTFGSPAIDPIRKAWPATAPAESAAATRPQVPAAYLKVAEDKAKRGDPIVPLLDDDHLVEGDRFEERGYPPGRLRFSVVGIIGTYAQSLAQRPVVSNFEED
jgi:hypothetical protein